MKYLFAVMLASVPLCGSIALAVEPGRIDLCGGFQPLGFKKVPQTVMVPEWCMEKRTVKLTETHKQVRTLPFTNYRQVPVTVPIPFSYDLPETVQRTKEIAYTVPVAFTREVTHEYTVLVPRVVKKQGIRKVPKVVACPVPPQPSGAHHPGQPPVGPCGDMKYRIEECDVPFEYDATIAVPEKRCATVPVTDYKMETRVKPVTYTVVILRKECGTAFATDYKTEPFEDIFTYTALVPVCVDRVIDVPVVKMVPRTVMVDVPICPNCHAQNAPGHGVPGHGLLGHGGPGHGLLGH